MKVLLAGGSGFLGSHLAEALIKKGYEVDVLDNLSSGLRENLDSIKDKISFTLGDVIDFKSDKKYDYVLNFASNASRMEWEKFPVEVALSNSLGSKNLIELSLRSNAMYIYASSSEIYGNPTIIPTPEEYVGSVSTTGTRSAYDEGKRFGDALTKAYEREHGLRNIIIRFFNTYGPRMRGGDFYGRVVDRFVKQAIANEPLTIYGNGEQTRSFTYVSDTVQAIILLMEKGKSGEVYNVGNDREIKIIELANIVKRTLSSGSEMKFLPLPEHDPKRRAADISKIRKLGFHPEIDIENGITMMANSINKKR
ncbi:MAG: NAD-dependent epimerase/dehydratase family protein [Thermoplasmataceae archaeon]